ncbi:MAG: hypothetical protein J6112_02555, partial [Clostridia bacterium]|nr:hypothetical protein [Clostridia bacterium]
MKKTLALILASLLVAGLLYGCSPSDGVHVSLDKKEALAECFFLTNQCDVSFDGEGTGNSPWFTVNLEYANDPHVNFNFKQYLESTGKGSVDCTEYPFIVLKIKTKNCNDNSFMLYANTAGMLSPDPNVFRSSFYDNTSDDWNYVVFDFTDSGLSGNYSYFRFDFEKTATSKGESCCVAEMIFMKTEKDTLRYLRSGSDDKAFTKEEEQKLNELFANYEVPVPDQYKTYKAKKAAAEDSGLIMKFNHSFTKTARENTKAEGGDSYCMYMAKNELEVCQLVLTAKDAREGLTLEVSDFVHENGGVSLPVEVFEGTYFEVEGENVIDPLPPLSGSFGVDKNTSKSLVIKTGTKEDSREGVYKATVELKNSSGEVIKTADIFAYVWNFTLPEETSCKTL